ncbi:MAG: hypothetical protein ACYDED_11430 [Ferrimicrobium sp.]
MNTNSDGEEFARRAEISAKLDRDKAEAARREVEAQRLDALEARREVEPPELVYRRVAGGQLVERLEAAGVDLSLRAVEAETVGWLEQYGKDRPWLAWGEALETRLCPAPGKLVPVSWSELKAFVLDYAWLNAAFREALSKPCWPLHPDVAEAVTMLFLGRKSYEEARAEGCRIGEHAAFLDLRDRCVAEIAEGLKRCTVVKAAVGEGPEFKRGLCVRHSVYGADDWGAFVLGQSEFEGTSTSTPLSPSMDVARGDDLGDEADLEADLAEGLGEGESLPRRAEPRPARGTSLNR